MRSKLLTLALFLPILTATPALAQNGRGAPSGAEISAKARNVRLQHARAGYGKFDGKDMKMTPADLRAVAKSLEDIKAGQVVGVLENGAEGDETGLPPGKYNLYVAHVDGEWKGYAEANGRIVSPAIRAMVTENAVASQEPQFMAQGWCYFISWQQLGLLWLPGGIYLCF
jgi:hypothetical protein